MHVTGIFNENLKKIYLKSYLKHTLQPFIKKYLSKTTELPSDVTIHFVQNLLTLMYLCHS